ncbi:hypothetical protein Ahy_B07g088694 isoform C [Arachis hypogaea]|uniref:Uncharacterized protein n=1 Tax=Arachis hypogaea TaxID=3818 RepID=A0A444YF67_ARAHY|nr:hypothetical protein Ahy_B07g088694 isoform C [Arachis hypogaea]
MFFWKMSLLRVKVSFSWPSASAPQRVAEYFGTWVYMELWIKMSSHFVSYSNYPIQDLHEMKRRWLPLKGMNTFMYQQLTVSGSQGMFERVSHLSRKHNNLHIPVFFSFSFQKVF